jgi:hypothetical protein
MIKKIPRFPPEVHEFRVQGLEDAVVVLNSLYDVGVRLSKEQGYKMTVKAN